MMYKEKEVITTIYPDGTKDTAKVGKLTQEDFEEIEKNKNKFDLYEYFYSLIGQTVTVTHAFNPAETSIRNSYTTGEVLFIDSNQLVLLVTTRNKQNQLVENKVYFPSTGYVRLI